MKKAFSLLVILLLVFMGVWLLFGQFLLETLWPERALAQRALYAIAQDDRGNVYYVEEDGGANMLTVLDTAGNVLLDQELPVITSASAYHIDSIYVASTRNMLIAASEYDRDSERVTGVSLHLFYESGAHAAELLRADCSQSGFRREGESVFFTAFSETQTHVNIGLYQDGRIRTYQVEKGSSEIEAALVRDVEVEAPLYAAAVSPNHDIVTAPQSGGLHVYQQSNTSKVIINAGAILPDAIYPVDGLASYLHDAASGGIYRLSSSGWRTESYCSGDQVLETGSGLRYSDMRLIHVNPDGRVAGVAQADGREELFCGTRLLMSRIPFPGEEDSLWGYLGVAAIATGAVLLSILIWDAYCRLLKMRLYIMVRQALLIVAGVASMLYLLLMLVLEPGLTRMFSEQYQNRLMAAGETLAKAVESQADEAGVRALFQSLSAAEQEGTPIHFDLFDMTDGTLIASSDGYAAGTAAGLMPHRADMEGMLKAAEADGICHAETYETRGERAYCCVRLAGERVLCASAGMEDISRRIQSLTQDVSDFVFIAGAVLVVLLLLIELLTVHSIRRLKKGVDAVSGGDYNVTLRIHSGDEIENLANSFNTMTRLIRSSMDNLNRLNSSYFRFVPENMIRLLGARNVTDLDKGSCAKRQMTIMMVRFRFEKGEPQDTDELFANINRAMQELTGAVPENGGTVYDLRSDGFNAVFEGGCEDAVRAALKVRANAKTLNDTAAGDGARKVDVRLVLTVGDVMLGIVGDRVRLSPTAISDVIEEAESIMGIAEPSNLYICCTEAVMGSISGYRSRYIGLFETGHGMRRLYDLYDGDPFENVKHKQMCAGYFDQAVEAFYRKDFALAKSLFMEVVKISLSDKTSVNYMYYADQYMREAPDVLSYRALSDKGNQVG